MGKMIAYSVFKKIFDVYPGAPECEIYFKHVDDTYMIIRCNDCVTFDKCGLEDDGIETLEFKDLDTLYHADLIDGICLEKDWDKIETIVIDNSFDLAFEGEIEQMKGWLPLDI